MIQPEIGILGLGYLGQMLFRHFSWKDSSWAATLHAKIAEEGFPLQFKRFHFDWANESTWKNLPPKIHNLVITIPPILQDWHQENERVEYWCRWLKKRHQALDKIIYISSTGVYPNRGGLWKEDLEFKPDTLKGELRLQTEIIFQKYFNTYIIRAGAIYGPHRHIGLKILNQSPIPNGNQPIHRIHVQDLANVVKKILTRNDFPSVVNAIDLKPTPTLTVAKWVLSQNYPGYPDNNQLQQKTNFITRKHQAQCLDRKICNKRLIEQGRYQYLFPTYQEGIEQAVNYK